MPISFLEIIELPDGRLALRNAENNALLVTLDFTESAKEILQGQHAEVAKAMFDAGIHAACLIHDDLMAKEYSNEEKIIH